jgi:cell division septation protein DedD
MKQYSFLFLFFVLLLTACTSTQQTTQQKAKDNEIYVFDDANVKPAKDTIKAVETKQIQNEVKAPQTIETKEMPALKGMNYIVQLGAFSTKEKAEKFVSDNKGKLNYEMHISYSETVKLFVVQIPPFATKEEAEKTRNKLWETPAFKDAFVVTLEKK